MAWELRRPYPTVIPHAAVALSFWLTLGTAGPQQEEPAPAPAPQEPAAKPWLEEQLGIPVHGFLSMRYRLRATSDDRDQDLYQYLSADLGDPERHRLTGHFFLRATEDLDEERDVFNGITDTFDSNLNSRLYYGYLDVHRLGPAQTIRAGRQFLHETPIPFYFDGVWAESEELPTLRDLKAGVYGGIPVHLYESSPGGDSVWGAYLAARPWKGAQARVDYARVIDDYILGEQRNDLYGLGVAQQAGERMNVAAQYNVLEGESHDVLGRLAYVNAEADLDLAVSYTQLFETQKTLAIDVDSFFLAARDYFPYHQVRLLAGKGLCRHSRLQAGADVRELVDEGDEAPLNREFRRFFVTAIVTDWPQPRLAMSLTVEMWDVPGSDDGDILTGGFDVTYKASDELKLSGGTSYALYKFDVLADEERENVRTYYAKGTYLVRENLKAQLGVEFEDADVDEFWTVKVGLTQSF